MEASKELDHGLDFYATQTLLDPQGRRIAISWMQMWGRTFVTNELGHGWNGGMTLPRVFHLQDNRLVQTPIESIQNYYVGTRTLSDVSFVNASLKFSNVEAEVGVLEVVADLSEAQSFFLQLRASATNRTVLSYDVESQEVKLDRTESGYAIRGEEGELFFRKVYAPLLEGKLKLEVFLDRSSIEVFVNDGAESFTALAYPYGGTAQLLIFGGKGRVLLESVRLSLLDF